MSASSTWTSLTVCNLTLSAARCTGFTKVHGESEFMYIIDLEWTDERTASIKRTFSEFQRFHSKLGTLFPELSNANLSLRTSLRENVVSIFTKDKRVLAEKKELILDGYLFHLLRQPERIRYSSAVLSFFESRDGDPKPSKSNSPSEKADSGIDLTGDNVPARLNAEIQHGASDNEECAKDYYRNRIAIDDDNEEDEEDERGYNGDTSGTETDDEAYYEDYFLEVGFGDLMLQTSTEVGGKTQAQTSPTTDDPLVAESSIWCSNLDKFSNILRSSMTNLSTATESQPGPHYRVRCTKSLSSSGENPASKTVNLEELAEESSVDGREETSETESQRTPGEDRQQASGESEPSDEDENPLPPPSPPPHHHKLLSKQSNIRH